MKRRNLILLSVPPALGVVLALYLHFSNTHAIHLWDCPLYKAFGLACPGCGATRGVCAILRFEFWQAFRYNALIFVLFFAFAGAYFYNIYYYVRFDRFITLDSRLLLLIAAVVVVFGVVRNLGFYPFKL